MRSGRGRAILVGGIAVVAVVLVVIAARTEHLDPQERVDIRDAIALFDVACARPGSASPAALDAAAKRLAELRDSKGGASYRLGLDVEGTVAQLLDGLRDCRGAGAAALAPLR